MLLCYKTDILRVNSYLQTLILRVYYIHTDADTDQGTTTGTRESSRKEIVMMFALPDHLTGADIKKLRKKLGCTQQGLADFLNISKKTIERWESGKAEISGPIIPLFRILDEEPRWFSFYDVPPQTTPLRLRYMFREELCTLIDVDERLRTVQIRNYTNKLQFRAFGRIEVPTFAQYEEFLESRCFPRERDNVKLVLKQLDLPFYEPLLIIEKTEGRMAEDDFWIQIERMNQRRIV